MKRMFSTTPKTGVLMFNLGGPETNDDVETFLYNMFSDKHLIGMPKPVARFVANLRSRRGGIKERYQVGKWITIDYCIGNRWGFTSVQMDRPTGSSIDQATGCCYS